MNEAFHAAQANEAHLRHRAYFPRQLPLALPRRERGPRKPRLMEFPLVTLTWRHGLELTESGNAFFVDRLAPLRGDFLEVLWRLHPYHRDAEGNFTNVRPGRRTPSRLAANLAFLLLNYFCWHLDIHAAEFTLRRRLQEPYLDLPDKFGKKNAGAEPASPLMPSLSRLDDVSAYFLGKGWSVAEILDAGVAWTMQMFRAELIGHGKGERCIPPSAELYVMQPEPGADSPKEKPAS